jgi:hypothetical protein
VHLSEASPLVLRGVEPTPGVFMTRWQEAENRLHIMIDILAYTPTKQIKITFLNARNVIDLTREGKEIAQFKHESHAAIANAFSTIDVRYKTPTHRVLTQAFNEALQYPYPSMIYLFTDGVPSDQPVEAVAHLILARQSPERTPLTLLSCTNEDSEVLWMKEVLILCFLFFLFFTTHFAFPLSR